MGAVETLQHIRNWVTRSPTKPKIQIVDTKPEIQIVYRQAHPAQKFDRKSLLYAPNPDLVPLMVQYAMNHWVYTAVNKIAMPAAAAEFMITSRPDGMEVNHGHPLAALIGKYGSPSRDMDSFEFLEGHFQNLLLAGNSYWLWERSDGFGGAPDTVRLLEPDYMRVVPGANETVGKYVYWRNGQQIPYKPEQITHFKRANPYSRYYGLPAILAIFRLVLSDNEMIRWNAEFFSDELGIPSGILVVPPETTDAEIERYRDEFTAKHGQHRRVAII